MYTKNYFYQQHSFWKILGCLLFLMDCQTTKQKTIQVSPNPQGISAENQKNNLKFIDSQQESPLTTLSYTPGLDISSLDQSVNPCEDFYTYACGGWMKKNPIPADKAFWDVYGKLSEENDRYLWGLANAAARKTKVRTSIEQKVGDAFAACMDEEKIEKDSIIPLIPYLNQIEKIKSLEGVADVFGALKGLGVPLFGIRSGIDSHRTSHMIAVADVGGLGLPNRDYYLDTDLKSQEIRLQYAQHIKKILALSLIQDHADPQKREHLLETQVAGILGIERELAQGSFTQTQKKNPYLLDHPMTLSDLQKLTPSFSWGSYLQVIESPKISVLNVTEPDFFRQFEKLLQTKPISDWKAYLRWQLLHQFSPYLSAPFVAEHFHFYKKTLRGIEKAAPRWKRCIRHLDENLGEALGQMFVETTFSSRTKARAIQMVEQIEKAMEKRLHQMTWMQESTKKEALRKLNLMKNKIGYPESWQDYQRLTMVREDFLGNVIRQKKFEMERDLQKIGKPVDADEWLMTPPTVDAYYHFRRNSMNFPAGVLQPPLFDINIDEAPSFGNTGGTIGHELIHGFDDEGRQYDAEGNLRNWWSQQDEIAFSKRAQCIKDQYSQYPVVDQLKVNSQLSSGEDIADLAGLALAYDAWKEVSKEKKLEPIEGFTPEKRFFIGFAQWACANERDESKRFHAKTNPHSPHQYRINGVVANMPEFQQAFSCKVGQKMVREKRCQIW